MEITREKQIENLLVLHAVVEAQPADKLDLNSFHRCGAVYCIGGLVAITPFFQKQGIRPGSDHAPETVDYPLAYQVAQEYFGDADLFDGSDETHETDKAEALDRIKGAAYALLESS